MSKKNRIIELITIAVFISTLYGFGIWNLFDQKKDFSENENRVLATMPEFSFTNMFGGSFDTQFETWFSDHFVARDSWIETKAAVRKMSGSIENNSVYLGKDGRLIGQFAGYDETTTNNNISYINEFLEDTGFHANILLVPGAAYGEKQFLPWGAYNLDEKSLIEDIGKSFNNADFINLTDDILVNDDNYFKTDHHWNASGAFVGYQAICRNVLQKEPEVFTYEEVSNSFQGTMYSKSGAFWTEPESLYKILPDHENPVTVTFEDGSVMGSLYADENLSKKDAYTYYLDGNHAYTNIKTSVRNGKKAVIVKDSYAHILVPYLAQEYEEITMIDLRYYQNSVANLITDPDHTDLYFIYSLDTFTSDSSLAKLW